MGVRNFISTKYIGCRRDPISNLKSGGGASSYPGAKSLYLLDYSTATFTRTSEAAYVDPRQNWEFVDPTYGTEVTAHASELNSYDDWSVAGTPTSSSAVAAPSGEASIEISDLSTVEKQGIFEDFSATGFMSRWTLTAYILKDDDISRFPELGILDSANSPATYYAINVNTSTGETTLRLDPGSEYSPSSSVEDLGDWLKVSMSRFVRNVARVTLYPAGTNIAGDSRVAATGSATFGDLSLIEELHGAFKLANQPRIFSDGAILIEGSRTNEARMSPDMSQAHYTKVGATLTQSIGPAGDIGYYLATFGSATGKVIDTAVQHTNYPSTGTMCLSHYSKADANKDYAFRYSSSGSLVSTPTTASLDWSLRSYVATDFSARLGVINATGSFENDPLYIYGLQAEEDATFPSSFIRCEGTPATRASDSCIISAANVPQEMKTGAFEFDFWPEFSSTEAAGFSQFVYLFGSTDLYFNLRCFGDVQVRAGSDAVITNSPAITFDAHQKITMRYDVGTGEMVISGATTGNGTTAAVGTPDTWEGDIYVGSPVSVGGTAGQFFGVISQPRRVE